VEFLAVLVTTDKEKQMKKDVSESKRVGITVVRKYGDITISPNDEEAPKKKVAEEKKEKKSKKNDFMRDEKEGEEE